MTRTELTINDFLPETVGYVVVQPGYAIFGAGETPEGAWADAEKWAAECNETTDGLELREASPAMMADGADYTDYHDWRGAVYSVKEFEQAELDLEAALDEASE